MRIDITDHVIWVSTRAGASDVEVSVCENESVSLGTRLGRFEKYDESSSCAVVARAFVGDQVASASTEDTSVAGLTALGERVVEMAKAAPSNGFLRLPDESEAYIENDYSDDIVASPSKESMLECAKEAESTALSCDGIYTSEGADVSYSYSKVFMRNSKGAHGYDRKIRYCSSIAVVAKSNNGEMESDYDFSLKTSFDTLKKPHDIGKTAAERAIMKLGGRKIKSYVTDVIFDRRVSGQLLGYLLSAVNGHAVYKKATFLHDKLGEQIFRRNINIVDDPLRPGGIKSSKFDAELVRCAKRNIVRDGVLQEILLDIESANRLGMRTTGHAGTSAYNAYIENGDVSLNDMIKSMKSGILITSVMGIGIDMVSGNYSQGISGFMIENGELAYPVKEITVADNMLDIFERCIIADDLEHDTGCDAPSILVENVAIAGE